MGEWGLWGSLEICLVFFGWFCFFLYSFCMFYIGKFFKLKNRILLEGEKEEKGKKIWKEEREDLLKEDCF